MPKIRMIIFIMVIFGVIGISLKLGLDVYSLYQPIKSNPEANSSDVFVVPLHSSAQEVIHALYTRHWIKSRRLLLWIMNFQHASLQLKSGIYSVDRQTSVMKLLENMVLGKVLTEKFRIVEGSNLSQVTLQLQQAPYLVGQDAAFDKLNLNNSSAEGSLLADTYIYNAGTTAALLLQLAHAHLEHNLQFVWQGRDENLPYKNSYELLIVASILEKETALSRERRLIAGVIANRLNKHMRLQMDPTVIYALGPLYKHPLTHNDLAIDSPYNTYRYSGLPPTPIAMVGRDSLQAAAHPIHSNYFYFVAKGDGTHQFSTTYAEQKQAIANFLHHKVNNIQ